MPKREGTSKRRPDPWRSSVRLLGAGMVAFGFFFLVQHTTLAGPGLAWVTAFFLVGIFLSDPKVGRLTGDSLRGIFGRSHRDKQALPQGRPSGASDLDQPSQPPAGGRGFGGNPGLEASRSPAPSGVAGRSVGEAPEVR